MDRQDITLTLREEKTDVRYLGYFPQANKKLSYLNLFNQVLKKLLYLK